MSQQQLYTNIFGAASDKDPVEKLSEIINKYPYYATAHYYLLQHASRQSPEYTQIAGRTALHFNNPYYLHYLLDTDRKPAVHATNNQSTLSERAHADDQQVVPMPEVADEPIEKAPEPAPEKSDDQELVFEPLHTTDYFASQGIKLSEEVKPDDKLGKQLRSFTDWLKTMKKVHEQRLPAGNAALDVTVQTIAEKSNQEEEVITESMADVYKEQGKANKAREIYQKLSLLDPSKSAYFAAKIDSLKDL